MTRYALALGSNQGDRVGHLRVALDEVGRLGTIRGVSGVYETEPIGGPDQDPYLNAVVVLETATSPLVLLDELQGIEVGHGRTREVRWGPRTLDLDIVATDGEAVESADLQIPHPRAAERRFVLEPLAEIWPEAEVGPGRSASAALGSVTDQGVELLATDWVDPVSTRSDRFWALAQLVFIVAIGLGLLSDGSLLGAGLEVVRAVGALILVIGLVLVVAAARALGQFLTIMPEPVAGGSLIETGIYAHARHPIYGGVSLTMLGISLLLASLSGAVMSVGLFVFLWAKSGYEERRLRLAYPGYSAYRRRVRRGWIPYLL